LGYSTRAQLYFPPTDTNHWQTTSPQDLGWCQAKIDSLYALLDSNDSKAFILLKDGKIVLEKYFNGHSDTSRWYWASAAKTITAFMVGMAQQEGYLTIDDSSSKYLGAGWTSCTPSQEGKITIRHQLSMNTGLDDGVNDPYCTDDTCLKYLADPNTRWAYHNAPYTLLDEVLRTATGRALNTYIFQKLKKPTGMDGFFIKIGYNNLYNSTARSMARFGLLILNNGNWDGTPILTDSTYFNQMVNTSQTINPSYGYLWWLNGKSKFMLPGSQAVFNGSITPQAPADMIAGIGANGQYLNVVPSQNLVWIRMGNNPDNSLVPTAFHNEIWDYLNDLTCGNLSVEANITNPEIRVFPNPVQDVLTIQIQARESLAYRLINVRGQTFHKGHVRELEQIDVSLLPEGVYFLQLEGKNLTEMRKIVIRH
jgi:CubicO group peptidase (beta-lactamase class C family)